MAFDVCRRSRFSLLTKVTAAWLALSVLRASIAFAEPSPADRETARTLMSEGDDQFDRKDYTEALARYRAAHAIMNVPTTGVAVAQALAAMGQFVEARDMALAVVRMPASANEPRPFKAARQQAEKLAGDVGPRIGALNISLRGPADTAAARIEVDGDAIPNASIGVARSANPGAHTVRASLPGCDDDEKRVSVDKGQTVAVVLQLKCREAPAVASAMATKPAPSVAPRSNGQRIAGAFVGGAGVAAMVTGGVIALAAKSKYDGAPHCDDAGCEPDGVEVRNAAIRQGNAATIVFGAGIAALAGGAVLWLTAPSAPVTVGLARSSVVAKVTF